VRDSKLNWKREEKERKKERKEARKKEIKSREGYLNYPNIVNCFADT
jgi:hypothetical protein